VAGTNTVNIIVIEKYAWLQLRFIRYMDFFFLFFFFFYRVVQKVITLFYFCDNFRKCTPIITLLTFLSLLQEEMYDAKKITSATSPLLCNHPT